MRYDSNSQRQTTASSDPIAEMMWKFFIVLLCVLGAPLLLFGHLGSSLIEKHVPHRQHLVWSVIGVLALIGIAIGYHFFWPLTRPGTPLLLLLTDIARGVHKNLQFNYLRLLQEIVPVWAMELLLLPVTLLGFAVHHQTLPKSPTQLAHRRIQQKQAGTQQARKSAQRTIQKKEIPEALTRRNSSTSLVLGVPIEGTLQDWIKNRLLTLPVEELLRHITVIGASGSGKSETLLRLAGAAAKTFGWQVIYIDAKGDYKAAAKFLLMMQQAGISNVRMFPLESYDGWRGSRDALLSKLLAIDHAADVTSAGQHHYATIQENLVEMCVNAPGGPPCNSQELLRRLMITNGILYDLYHGYAEQQSYLDTLLERPQEALGAYGHYRAFFSKAHGKLDGTWSFDDCDAAYVLLDGLALPEITDGMGRFLMADFVNYATRKDWNKQVLFIFDEVGSLNLPLYNIFEKVRFRQVSVVVSSQDPSGLAHKPGGVGTWDEVRRVLGNSAIKIVHRCEDASEVIRRAGTVPVANEQYQMHDDGTSTGAGTMLFREALKIDQNEVLRLTAGETFVIGAGEYERVRVAMLPVDEERWKALYKQLEQQSKQEPPPLQKRSGGPSVVDSTLASASSTKRSAGTAPANKAGDAQSAAKKSSSPSAGQPSGQKPPAKKKAQSPMPTPPRQSSPQKSSASLVVIHQHQLDVDETLPSSLLDTNENVPIQPGVLPMWDEDMENMDEDLLP